MRALKIMLGVLSFAFLSSCASTYKSIEPSSFNFTNTEITEGVSLKYRYDVLRERGNKKFGKDEISKGVKITAVEITNHTEESMIFGKDIVLHSGETKVNLLSPLSASAKIKQCAACYIPYGLLTLLRLETGANSYPIGYVVGPLIMGGNMFTAYNANQKLKAVLMRNDLEGKEILPGQTIHGLISVNSGTFEALKPVVVK